MTVLDSSAILAFLLDEPGADDVEAILRTGAQCGAANWSEVAQKVMTSGADWQAVRSLLESYDLIIEPVTAGDAELAARLWKRGSGLSLGDRLCLALAERLTATAVTADRAWAGLDKVTLIR